MLGLDLNSGHPEPDCGGDGCGGLTGHSGPGSGCGSGTGRGGGTLLSLAFWYVVLCLLVFLKDGGFDTWRFLDE